jgi:hypothetical protein
MYTNRALRAKPLEVGAIVISVLIESQKERVSVSGSQCEECLPRQMYQTFRLKPGQLSCVRVVESEQRLTQHSRLAYVGRTERG